MKIDAILNKSIKTLTIIVLAIALCVSIVFIVPPVYVFAETSPVKIPITSSQPDYATISNIGLLCGESSYYNGNVYVISSGNNNVYCGVGTNTVYLASDTNFSGWYTRPKWSTSISYAINSPSWNTDYNLYYTSFGAEISTASSSVPVFSNYTSFLSAVQDVINAPQGEFYSLPQVGASVEIDYSTVAAQGAFIYANNSTYSYLGQYTTEVSPTSKYCYVQTGTDAYTPVVFSSVPLTVYNAFINGQTYSYFVCAQYETGKYCYTVPTYATADEIAPCVPFENLTAAKEAFAGAPSGGGAGSAVGVASAGSITLQVPAGNVLYVKPRAGSQARLEVTYSYPSNNSSPYWGSSAKWVSGVSSLPSEGVTMPLSGMTQISWSVDDSVTDPQGRSYNGYTTHAPFNAGWFVVWNPLYYNVVAMDGGNTNRLSPTITVKMQYALEYHIYPLTENVVTGVTTSKTDYDTGWNGEYDSDNDDWNRDSSGVDTEDPVVGGQQSSTIGQTLGITDYLHQIGEALTNFANNVTSLFTAPIAHIQQLIVAGTSFFSVLAGLWSWLPSELSGIMLSAAIVLVAVGVFKHFLK